MEIGKGSYLRSISFGWLLFFVLLLWVFIFTVPKLHIDTVVLPPSAVLPDGSEYYGDMDNGLLHGKGKLLWPNGNSYIGEFAQGRMHGQGSLNLASGDQYVGEFRDGFMHGTGHFVAASGDEYRGEFNGGYMHGQGRFNYRGPNYYEGEFEYGYYHGHGAMHYGAENIFSGLFEDGNIVSGEHRGMGGLRYEGEFVDWAYSGKGQLVYPEGDVYEGYFEEGMLMADGKHTMSDGSIYEGQFLSSLYHGEGSLVAANGDFYEGAFEYGQFHGSGIREFKNKRGDVIRQEGQWQYGYYQDPEAASRRSRRLTIGNALYNQSELLARAHNAIQPNDEGLIDLYFLAGAGDGSQDVFLKEIQFVTKHLNELYALDGKSVQLINHVDTEEEVPVLTLTSLNQSLAHIAAKMDLENDIFMMYFSSHGSKTDGFYVNDKRMNLENLSAEKLSASLDAAKIKWRVVIISACYSGGFIPFLNDDYTLVITASRDDRQSFGCSNDADMTYFGRAFFQESLNTQTTFEQAFGQAKILVEQWEAKDEVEEHSEPQIHMGSKIADHLRRWRQQTNQGSTL